MIRSLGLNEAFWVECRHRVLWLCRLTVKKEVEFTSLRGTDAEQWSGRVSAHRWLHHSHLELRRR